MDDLYPTLACKLSATLTPARDFISLSPDFTTITVDASKISMPVDLKIHSFSVIIDSVDYPGTVSQLILDFDVDITCLVTSFNVISEPTDLAYIQF
jgi:hypothetical protein